MRSPTSRLRGHVDRAIGPAQRCQRFGTGLLEGVVHRIIQPGAEGEPIHAPPGDRDPSQLLAGARMVEVYRLSGNLRRDPALAARYRERLAARNSPTLAVP